MKKCDQKDQIISFYVVIRMPSQYAERCAIFARYFINKISEILEKHGGNIIIWMTIIIKNRLLTNGIPQM